MSHISNYPKGFMDGITIREVPLTVAHPGKIFWVSNSSVATPNGIGGSDSNPGTFNKPFSTIANAINNCVANRGDIIFVLPGYTQTITNGTSIVPDVAGVAIVGLGEGNLRPIISFSATTSNIILSGANSSIKNQQ